MFLSVLTWSPWGFWVVVKWVILDSTRASEVSALPSCRASNGGFGKGERPGESIGREIPEGDSMSLEIASWKLKGSFWLVWESWTSVPVRSPL